MRVVGGTLSGRRFSAAPSAERTRPTGERLREAIASALVSRDAIAGSKVLDLFAGTGAFSFEMLSRGAASALAVERSATTLRLLRKNATTLGLLAPRFRARAMDLWQAPQSVAEKLTEETPFDLLIADPPYKDCTLLIPLIERLATSACLADNALAILEFPHRTALPVPAGFRELKRYRIGEAACSLLMREPPRR